MRIYPELLVDQEFKSLGDQGFMGTLNDRQFAFLRSKGYVNALPDMMTSWLAFSFTPSSLFAASEPGIWLDPSDLTTMFQDRAGSTAVTTPGQSVGLRLDKSKGLVLGSELLGSGVTSLVGTATAATYSTSTGAGTVSRVDASNQSFVRWSSLNSNSNYKVRVTCTSGNISIRAGDITAQVLQTLTVGQTFDAYLVPVGGFLTISHAPVVGTSAFTVHSVKELPGNHAVANSDAARGIYGIEPLGGRRNLLLNTTTMATQNVTVTAVAHTLSFTGTGTVTLSGVSTAGPLVGTGANDRVSLTFTPTAGTLTLTISGSVTLAQLQIGSTFDDYQRVGTTQYDVTEAGKQTLHYVQYDGSDDGYVTPTISPESALVVSGPELVTNGDFASATGWTTGTGWSIGSGVATKIAGVSSNIDQALVLTAGRSYQITYTITSISVAAAFIRLAGATVVDGISRNTTGTFTEILVAPASMTTLSFRAQSTTNVTVDNISVREMSGAADKVQVFAGVRKLSDAALGVVVETSTAPGSGSISLIAPRNNGAATYGFTSRGTLEASATTAGSFAAPITNVLTGLGDIAGDLATLRVNGTQAAQSTADQGTGNFLAYPLYIGRRGGTTLPFNGRDYGIITRFGANLDASTIAATESWLNQRTGAF